MLNKHFTLKDRIEEVLEHFDYCLVSTSGMTELNKITLPDTTTKVLFRDLTIRFGPTRVSKVKGAVKII